MEEEAREILKSGLSEEFERGANLVESIRRHLAPLGCVEVRIPRREPARRPDFTS